MARIQEAIDQLAYDFDTSYGATESAPPPDRNQKPETQNTEH
ncbi:hypothetical protein [Phototrophicus methaneseepsis]|nr:hypothetical protein [Phototrophicus methaneseepsis]